MQFSDNKGGEMFIEVNKIGVLFQGIALAGLLAIASGCNKNNNNGGGGGGPAGIVRPQSLPGLDVRGATPFARTSQPGVNTRPNCSLLNINDAVLPPQLAVGQTWKYRQTIATRDFDGEMLKEEIIEAIESNKLTSVLSFALVRPQAFGPIFGRLSWKKSDFLWIPDFEIDQSQIPESLKGSLGSSSMMKCNDATMPALELGPATSETWSKGVVTLAAGLTVEAYEKNQRQRVTFKCPAQADRTGELTSYSVVTFDLLNGSPYGRCAELKIIERSRLVENQSGEEEITETKLEEIPTGIKLQN